MTSADWVGVLAGAGDSLALAASGWMVAMGAAGMAAWQRWRRDKTATLVAEAAHELRGPLCAAQLAMGSLSRSFGAAPRAGRTISAIEVELGRAALAVEDLTAAIGSAPPSQGRALIDLAGLVRRSEPAWRLLAQAHGATLRVESDPALPVWGDSLRLVQAVANLIANAAEHAGGEVVVRVTATQSLVQVEVADDGPGLTPGQLAALPRSRRGSRRAGTPGPRGHGLGIAAQVAQAHGGRLTAAPAPRGARLVIELPVATTPSHAPTGEHLRATWPWRASPRPAGREPRPAVPR